jgi:hypothetical protein
MLKVALVATWMAVLLLDVALAQNHPTPTTPGSPAPLWQRMVQLDDGRTIVTDGGMAIDAAVAKPTLPNNALAPVSGKIARDISLLTCRASLASVNYYRATLGQMQHPVGSC